jgi:molybdopterin-guanine dinucleotide biosynthesis protein A
LDRSAIILTDEVSNYEQDKALLELKGKSLLRYVVDAASTIVDNVFVVTDTAERAKKYAELVGPDVKFAVNVEEAKGPLVDALTGLMAAQGKYSLLLPSNAPFVSLDLVQLFFELCHGKTAVVPRWPNQEIDPLFAVYHTKSALEAARIALSEGMLNLDSMIDHLGGVRYISTLVVQEMDPDLKSFFKVNTAVEAKMAETLAKPRRTKLTKNR